MKSLWNDPGLERLLSLVNSDHSLTTIICHILLFSQLAKGPAHSYRLNQAIRDACQVCCEPTEAMVYSTVRELIGGGYVEWRMEENQGRARRVCWLTPTGEESFRAAARVWEKMLPKVHESVAQAIGALRLS